MNINLTLLENQLFAPDLLCFGSSITPAPWGAKNRSSSWSYGKYIDFQAVCNILFMITGLFHPILYPYLQWGS
jgi:hypothetical protein